MELTRLNTGQFKELASSKHGFKKGCLSLLVIFLCSCGENVKQTDTPINNPSMNGIEEPIEKEQVLETESEVTSLSIELLPKAIFHVDDSMIIKVHSQKAGYLFVWDIGNGGEISPLYPNQHVKHKPIKAKKTVTIPENSLAGYGLTVGEPIGQSKVVALLVDESKVQLVQPKQLETIAKPNAQTAWQQLLQQLNDKLGQEGWETATQDYEIKY